MTLDTFLKWAHSLTHVRAAVRTALTTPLGANAVAQIHPWFLGPDQYIERNHLKKAGRNALLVEGLNSKRA